MAQNSHGNTFTQGLLACQINTEVTTTGLLIGQNKECLPFHITIMFRKRYMLGDWEENGIKELTTGWLYMHNKLQGGRGRGGKGSNSVH